MPVEKLCNRTTPVPPPKARFQKFVSNGFSLVDSVGCLRGFGFRSMPLKTTALIHASFPYFRISGQQAAFNQRHRLWRGMFAARLLVPARRAHRPDAARRGLRMADCGLIFGSIFHLPSSPPPASRQAGRTVCRDRGRGGGRLIVEGGAPASSTAFGFGLDPAGREAGVPGFSGFI